MPNQERRIKNQLLLALSLRDFELIETQLEHVYVEARARLVVPNKRIEHVYFLEQGLASVGAGPVGSKSAEVGIFGREGMSGLALVQGSDRSPHECCMIVPGHALRIAADDLLAEFGRSPTLRITLLRFAHAFMIQMGETARANGRLTVETRLARWLLMAQDRLEADGVPLTHDLLSNMVGTRRVGVTIALKDLEALSAIRTERGRVVIHDREKLAKIAGDSYGVAESYWIPLHESPLIENRVFVTT